MFGKTTTTVYHPLERRSRCAIEEALVNQIKKLRQEQNLTQWEVVERMGGQISQSTLSLWELGRRRPAPDQLAALAKALGVTPKALRSASRRR